jgi:hypothetical protein
MKYDRSLPPNLPRQRPRLALLGAMLIAAVLLSPPVGALSLVSEGVIANDGAVLRLLDGAYGELFPTSASSTSTPVLALDRRDSSGVSTRVLVPGSTDYGIPGTPAVAYERSTDTLYVAWLANLASLHFRLVVVSYQGGVFSEPTVITGDPFSQKAAPQIAITRDSFRLRSETGPATRHERLIVHATWWENGRYGEEIVYVPLIFVDGQRIGDEPQPTALAQLIGAGGEPWVDATYSLKTSPGLSVGGDGTLRLAFVDSMGRFITLGLKTLPVELSTLAESAGADVGALASSSCSGSAATLATEAAALTFALGQQYFHDSVAGHVAGEVQLVVSSPEVEPCALLEELPAQVDSAVLDSGAEALTADLVRQGSAARSHIVHIGREVKLGGFGSTRHLAAVRVLSVRWAPATSEGTTTILLSDDGRDAIVAWRAENSLLYTESVGDIWTTPRILVLDEDLDADAALGMLELRLRQSH